MLPILQYLTRIEPRDEDVDKKPQSNPLDLAIIQHKELCEKLETLNKGVSGIKLVPVTTVYLLVVSYFFYIGRISEYVWVPMVLYPMTTLYGDKFVRWIFDRRDLKISIGQGNNPTASSDPHAKR
jgi:hypothetical protein